MITDNNSSFKSATVLPSNEDFKSFLRKAIEIIDTPDVISVSYAYEDNSILIKTQNSAQEKYVIAYITGGKTTLQFALSVDDMKRKFANST